MLLHRDSSGGPKGTEGVVRFENVGLRYGLGPEVLRDLSFHIEPHSFQFLTGPSGAGKTSLLRLLFLSLKPTRGLITAFGSDVAARYPRSTLRAAVDHALEHGACCAAAMCATQLRHSSTAAAAAAGP